MIRRLCKRFKRWWQSHQSSNCYFTWEEALIIAHKYHLENEIKISRSMGLTPDEALEDWDLFPYEKVMDGTLKKKKYLCKNKYIFTKE